MNKVMLMGRLTRDPELAYTTTNMAVCRFSVAVDRMTRKGEEKQADYPNVKAFGKLAENVDMYTGKGKRVLVEGRLQTGSYEKKDGTKVYYTEVLADRVEFIDFNEVPRRRSEEAEPPEGFAQLDEDVPF